MQIQGDIEKFKKKIDASFDVKLSEVKAALEAELVEVKARVREQEKVVKNTFTQKLKKETELAAKKELSTATCEARTAFDEEKQQFFETIFADVVTDAKSVDSTEFKSVLKSELESLSAADAKNATVIVSAKKLVPSSFNGTVEVTKDFLGAKIVVGESVTDLSLATLLEIHKEQIIVELHGALF